MKKIINKPSDFVEESIEGLVKSHPDVYAFAKDNKRVITRAKKVMHGKVSVIKHDESQLFNNIPKTFKATRYHSLIIDEKTIPNNLKINARSDDNTIMSISNPIGKAFGVQFHPESIETEFGINLIKNFIDMCKKNESNY